MGASQLRPVVPGGVRDPERGPYARGPGPAPGNQAEVCRVREARSHHRVLQAAVQQCVPCALCSARWLYLL